MGRVFYGAPQTIRTSDLSLRRGALYPAELGVREINFNGEWKSRVLPSRHLGRARCRTPVRDQGLRLNVTREDEGRR